MPCQSTALDSGCPVPEGKEGGRGREEEGGGGREGEGGGGREGYK